MGAWSFDQDNMHGATARKRPEQEAPASTCAALIVQAAVRPECSLAELGKLADGDPAFAMRVLRLVNSPAYRHAREITNVRQAVALVGIRGMRNLALGLVVSDMIPGGEAGRTLFAISLRRAVAAQRVADAMRLPGDGFFTAGLFLEIGLLCHAADRPEAALAIASGPAAHRVVREQAAGHRPHPETGAALAESYKLPQETVAAIGHHHDAAMPEGDVPRVAWLAEHVAALFEGGSVAEGRQRAAAAAERAGLGEDKLREVIDAIPAAMEDMARAFDHDLAPQLDLDALMLDANRSLIDLNAQYEELVQTLRAVIAEKESLAQQLRAANAQLATLAATDPLTGLANKRALLEALHRDLSQAGRESAPLSLVMIDVDHFKRFNDRWGHAAGDAVLRALGELLPRTLRGGDLAARYGGEEFTLVLPHADAEGARIVAERVRVALEQTLVQGPEGGLHVTASLGVATVEGAACQDATDSLFKRADDALYQAKRAGRNRVVSG